MRYLPHTEQEIHEMLARIGVRSIDELFEAIPATHRLGRPLALEKSLDEAALMGHLGALAERNDAARALSFLGGGMYDHHIPPSVDQLLLRSEFYTSYTPYQAEVAQGTLQAVFEFQTIVCQLFNMHAANASMYDGASATAEAALMARRITGRKQIIASAALHPHYIETVRTYLSGLDESGAELEIVGVSRDGRTDLDALRAAVSNNTAAAVLVGYPNFFGCVEDLAAIRALTRDHKTLVVTSTSEPYALSLVRAPGDFEVDIAVGEGQALAVPPQFGGPGVGLFACREEYLRQIPGRLVGETVDAAGKRGFVLTLSTREQHIRRERATSNICTNHGLIALAFAIRTSMLGRRGFVDVGELCLSRAEYLKKALVATGEFSLPFAAPTFNEFVVRRRQGKAKPLLDTLGKRGILAGIDLGVFYPDRDTDFLIAVTERHDKEALDRLVRELVAG